MDSVADPLFSSYSVGKKLSEKAKAAKYLIDFSLIND
jgi:hypothetical protein